MTFGHGNGVTCLDWTGRGSRWQWLGPSFKQYLIWLVSSKFGGMGCMECRVMQMNTVPDAVQWMVGYLKTIHDAGEDSREAIEHLEATTRRRYPLSERIVYLPQCSWPCGERWNA